MIGYTITITNGDYRGMGGLIVGHASVAGYWLVKLLTGPMVGIHTVDIRVLSGDNIERSLKRYISDERDQMFREAGKDSEFSRHDMDKLYPDHYFTPQYIQRITDWARAGYIVPNRALDALYEIEPRAFFSLRHDYPDSISPEYCNPTTRASNKAYTEDMRAARKRGKAAGSK